MTSRMSMKQLYSMCKLHVSLVLVCMCNLCGYLMLHEHGYMYVCGYYTWKAPRSSQDLDLMSNQMLLPCMCTTELL